jgi:hypothetical protein
MVVTSALGYHLVDEAPLLGLQTLPLWPRLPEDDLDARIGRHWKTRSIVDRAWGGDAPPRTTHDRHLAQHTDRSAIVGSYSRCKTRAERQKSAFGMRNTG